MVNGDEVNREEPGSIHDSQFTIHCLCEQGIRLIDVDAVLDDGSGNLVALDLAFVSQSRQRGQRNPATIHFEVVTQSLAGVRTAKAIRAEHHILVRHIRANLFGIHADVVGGDHDRANRAP